MPRFLAWTTERFELPFNGIEKIAGDTGLLSHLDLQIKKCYMWKVWSSPWREYVKKVIINVEMGHRREFLITDIYLRVIIRFVVA